MTPRVYLGSEPDRAKQLAKQLGLKAVAQWDASMPSQLYLQYCEGQLALGLSPAAREHPVSVDFLDQYLRRRPGKELLLKALGGRRKSLTVIDTTAGLGRDAFLIASYGAVVTMCERQPVVAALLEDGLDRACREVDIAEIIARMSLRTDGAECCLEQADDGDAADVIYLDPMFPESGKAALVKKDMRLFHDLVGKDEDAAGLLALALRKARHRVVVKRPPKAPALAGVQPQFAISGKAVRFDVYPLRTFPT